MDALSLPPDCLLPDDVPTLQAMVGQLLSELARLRQENATQKAQLDELLGEVARLREENAALKARLDLALKHRFGRRSERQPRQSKPADDQLKRKATPHGRAPLPEHLERRDVHFDLTEAEKLCPCCGKPRVCIGTQQAEQLDMEPARLFVRRTIRKTYACQDCEPGVVPVEQRFQTAGPAEV